MVLKNYAKLFEFHVVCQMYPVDFLGSAIITFPVEWFFASNREKYLATKMQWKIHNTPLKMLTLKSCENKGHLQDPGYTSALEKMRKKVLPHANSSFTIFTSSNLRDSSLNSWFYFLLDDVTNVTVIWSGRKKITFIAGLIK